MGSRRMRGVLSAFLLGMAIWVFVSVLIFDSFVWNMPWWGWFAYLPVVFLLGCVHGSWWAKKSHDV